MPSRAQRRSTRTIIPDTKPGRRDPECRTRARSECSKPSSDPIPYGSLSIVQADLNDGQEYDGLVFLATKFYNEYEGSARSNLVAIGVHEMAHQWWFGLVGNDQAMEPWLDEALAVYSEAIFYKFIYPNSSDWWWNFRVNYFGPSGYVDTNDL